MSLVCVHHVYWWFSTVYEIYMRSVSRNRIFSQISYVKFYNGSKSSTHDTHAVKWIKLTFLQQIKSNAILVMLMQNFL